MCRYVSDCDVCVCVCVCVWAAGAVRPVRSVQQEQTQVWRFAGKPWKLLLQGENSSSSPLTSALTCTNCDLWPHCPHIIHTMRSTHFDRPPPPLLLSPALPPILPRFSLCTLLPALSSHLSFVLFSPPTFLPLSPFSSSPSSLSLFLSLSASVLFMLSLSFSCASCLCIFSALHPPRSLCKLRGCCTHVFTHLVQRLY